MRDASTPVLCVLLASATAAAALAPEGALWPTTPAGLAALVVAIAAGWAAVGVPAVAGAPARRALEVLAVVVVPLQLCARASPAPLVLPWALLAAASAFGTAASLSPAPWRGRAALLGAALLGLPALFASGGVVEGAALAGVPVLPSRPLAVENALSGGRPVAPRDLVPPGWRGDRAPATLRAGALARSPDLAEWGGRPPPWARARWAPVPAGTVGALPSTGPVVRVVAATQAPARLDGASLVAGAWDAADPLDLDPFDAVLLRDGAPGDAASAQVLAGFVRRGGLLVGPPPPAPWPDALLRALRAAASVDEAGPAGAHAHGAGRVARGDGAAGLAALLARGLHRPRAGTVFDRALVAPPSPFPVPDAPRGVPWPAAALAAVWLLGLAGLSAVLRGAPRAVLVVAAAAGGGLLLGEATPGARTLEDAQAFVIEVGGVGGRRVEGVCLAAGPSGWRGPASGDLEVPDGGLRALGFSTLAFDDGLRWALRPGARGWLVVERAAVEDGTGFQTVAQPPAWAIALLVGEPSQASAVVQTGSSAYRGPRLPGVAIPAEVPAVLVPLKGR